MKQGFIGKTMFFDQANQTADMLLINQYTRKELKPEDVYIFPVIMCDNEIDRDFEKFTVDTLKELAELYKGKTMIFDHRNSATNQSARIFDTYIEIDDGKTTKDGEAYTKLVGKVYMSNSESNKNLIDSIDAGILKEVSVGCAVGQLICSICKKEKAGCKHIQGRKYDGQLCYTLLEKATDAYELSLVAVPSQKGAGITKMLDSNEKGEVENMELFEKIKELTGVEVLATDTLEGGLEKLAKALGSTAIMTATLEVKKEFLSADVVKASVGKEVTSEKALEMLTDYESLKARATEFDTLKSGLIESALKNGIKAKGEKFNREVNEKILKGLSYSDIETMSHEWLEDAAAALKAGRHISQYTDNANTGKSINIDNYSL